MPSATYTCAVQPTAPWAVSTKTSAYTAASQPYQPSPVYGQLYQPPPSRSESITTGGGSYSIPSRAQSVSSYSGSESNSPVDALGYMGERLNRAMDPTPLDRSLAVQAQRSGELNAKTRELQALQALAQSRLKSARRNFADGIQAAKDVQRDLEWTQGRVGALNQRAAQRWPAQYATASSRFPPLEDY
ncbi:hypothetical protein D6C78_04027 [Aureobasidium pullulans]|uniref:Biogenesis of lysosome-related organelles complex 1 subunit KXD1 n=1 Tax=Aureobasidium pullulans TaxID=5580 RepID=A0A4T0BVQ1_AURPU|nr:hypothetical protein D6C78_04027 [Aureobasidium pullulans]